jgi:DNA-binding phage protein
MPEEKTATRIPPEVLDEQWFSFFHKLIAAMRVAFRASDTEQKTIAQRLGKKASFISRCLSGQQNMTVRTIHDIARAMGYRLEITLRPLSSVQPANQWGASEPKMFAAAKVYTKSVEYVRH